jgi:hypothetical protein
MAIMQGLFNQKSIDVIRVLLVDYPKRRVLWDLARAAHVSPGRVSKVVGLLIAERLALVSSPRAELILIKPFSLLKRWAAVNNFTAHTRSIDCYTSENDVSKFLERLKLVKDEEYALTGLAGALLVAPFVSPTKIHVYVNSPSDVEKMVKELGLMPVEGNGNVKFAIPESRGVFYGARDVSGVRVVSDIQLYVDLLNYPARGKEAAAEVYKIIEKRWREAETP